VQSELEQLLVLQDRQQKIRQIQNETKTIPLQRKQLEDQAQAQAAEVEALKHQGRHLEVDRKKMELDVATRNDSIAKLRTQQYETRKNDEFAAMGHEIERYQKEITAIEDRELELMEAADQLKARLANQEKQVAAAKASILRQMGDLETKEKTLDSRLQELTRESEEIAHQIDEDLLSLFKRLFASKGDAAVVALEHEVCTGCHMKLTTQTAHRVKGGREIVNCEQCGRILYSAD
jgi:hypothetical protein